MIEKNDGLEDKLQSKSKLEALERNKNSKIQDSKFNVKKFKNFFAPKCFALSSGVAGCISCYALLSLISKKISKNQKIYPSLFCGLLTGVAVDYFVTKSQIVRKKSNEFNGLIDRAGCNLDFWLNNEQAKEYFELRKKTQSDSWTTCSERESSEDLTCLTNFINDIKIEVNKKYYDAHDYHKKGSPEKDFFENFNVEAVKRKKVRIFDQYIAFNSLCSFIEDVDRNSLLKFLSLKATIKYNLQGELIKEERYFTECSSQHLAAFLAFGYYADTCGKFLYLQPNILMTFLENALYFMYYQDNGERQQNMDIRIREVFEKHCKVKIANVEFKKTGKIKKYPTTITIEEIREKKT